MLKGNEGDALLKHLTEIELGYTYLKQGRKKEAEKAFVKSLEYKDDGNALFELGTLYLEQKRYSEAEKVLRRCMEKGEKQTKYATMSLGSLYMNQGRNTEAEEQFLKYISIDKDENPHARLKLGKLYANTGKDVKAREQFEKCIEITGNTSPHARLELGKLYKRQGKDEEAEQEFREYIRIDGDKTGHGRLELGRLYRIQKKFEQAEKELEICRKIEEDDPKFVDLELGIVYFTQGKYEKAKEYFGKCVEEDPNLPHVRMQLGKLYIEQGRYEEAEAQLKKYIEMNGDKKINAILELARMYALQGKDEQSAEMYKCILDNMDEEIYDEENRMRHIQKHLKDDKTKRIHGVFTKDIREVLDIAIKNRGEKKTDDMYDIYCVEVPNCGYQGGYEGDGHILNYVTLVTLPCSEKIITFFPNDKLIMKADKIKEANDTKNLQNDENNGGEEK